MPLHHSPIYQSLLHDLLGLKSNHVEITSADDGKKRVFLDHESDDFWRQNAQQPFPKVHEYHTTVLSWYKKRKDEIQNKGGGAPSTSPSNDYDADFEEKKESESEALKSAIRSMPQLLRKKEEIDRHQQLMSSISDVLSERSISEYFHLEEALMHSKVLNSAQSRSLMDQLSPSTMGTVEDKLRLFLIYYLCHHDVTRSTLNQLLSALLSNDGVEQYALPQHEQTKHKLKALQYVVEHKKLLNLGDSLKDADEEKVDAAAASTSWGGLFESGKTLLSKVKGMLPTSGNCTVTRIAKLLMNTDVLSSSVNLLSQSQSNPHLKDINKNYVTFDPLRMNDAHNLDKLNFQQYERALVFVVGGGCYSEYSNLMEFARSKHKDIIYGCTDLVTPNDFLHELSNLA